MNDNVEKAKEAMMNAFFKKADGCAKVLASGDESDCEYGFIHTWYIDGPGASFGGTKAGVHWEIVACNSISEMNLNDYKNYKNFDEFKKDFDADYDYYKKYKAKYNKMKKFEKVLEDSYTTQFLEHPLNELEGFIRIW